MKYLLLFLLLTLPLRAELIPAARLVDWTIGTRVGVVGGIPTRTVIADDGNSNGITDSLESIDATGATDVRAAIQAALEESSSGEIVRLPAGTFRIDNTLTLGTWFSGRTLRGAGPSTIIAANCSRAMIVGSSSGYFKPESPGLLVTAGLSKGSTSLTLSGDHSYLTPGYMIAMQLETDDSIPVVSIYAYGISTTEATQKQVFKVVSKVGDVITITPPMLDAYGGGTLEARITTQSFSAQDIGIEDFTIDCDTYTNSFAGLDIQQCYNSWVTGVKSINAYNYTMIVANSLNCEVRGCWLGELKGSGTNGAGLLVSSWSCLYEDNVTVDAFPNVEVNDGSAGNAFLYNYGNAMCLTNHGPHNQFNLHEGNAWSYMLSDGYFGSESDLTVHRNYIWGPFGNVIMRRFSRRFSVVGNIMGAYAGVASNGFPNIGNVVYSGTASLIGSDPWRDYQMTGTLSTRTNDTSGVITFSSGMLFVENPLPMRFTWGDGNYNWMKGTVTNVTGSNATFTRAEGALTLPAASTAVVIGPGIYSDGTGVGNFQELDLDVALTTIDKGNHFIETGLTSSLGGDTLSNSLLGDSKAASEARGVVWGSLAWPPFNSADPSTANVQRIPAGYRYANGVDPGGGGGGGSSSITTGTLNVGTLRIGP